MDDASALPELYHCRLQLPVPPCASSDLAKHKCIRSSSLVYAVTVLVCCCSYPCCGLGALHHHMLLLLLLLPPAPQQQRASELHCAVKLPLQAALRVAHAASLNGLVGLTLLRCILKDELVLLGRVWMHTPMPAVTAVACCLLSIPCFTGLRTGHQADHSCCWLVSSRSSSSNCVATSWGCCCPAKYSISNLLVPHYMML